MLARQIRFLGSLVRESAKRGSALARFVSRGQRRSPAWAKVEARWKREHPKCAACGSTRRVQVHHVQPFHLRPELELADGTGEFCQLKDVNGRYRSNLISLCMDVHECHLRVGHLGDFRLENPRVVVDAAELLRHPLRRPLIYARLKAERGRAA